MNKILIIGIICFLTTYHMLAQDLQKIHKIPIDLLAGEGLDYIQQADSSRIVYQKKVYDGIDFAIFMVAIGTGITNEFENFPLEEFIFWMNGKAIVEPKGEESFPIYTGDYFIQAKGFQGKWNFVDIGGVHLELSLVAKNRPDAAIKSPISKALVINQDILSGVLKPDNGLFYEGPELTVRVLNAKEELLDNISRERMIHILNGILIITDEEQIDHHFYPGDFVILPKDFDCTFESNSLQQIRIIEVYKTKN